jgi:hypothetical protein
MLLTGRLARWPFGFVLQPAMAALMAVRDGVVDARTGGSPYFWTVLTNADERQARLREGFIATARIILLGIGMDAIYQLKVFGTFYPGASRIEVSSMRGQRAI